MHAAFLVFFFMYEAQHQSSPFFHQIVLSFLRISWKSRFSTFPLKTLDSSSAWQKPQQNEKGEEKKTLSFGTRKKFSPLLGIADELLFAPRLWNFLRLTTRSQLRRPFHNKSLNISRRIHSVSISQRYDVSPACPQTVKSLHPGC